MSESTMGKLVISDRRTENKPDLKDILTAMNYPSTLVLNKSQTIDSYCTQEMVYCSEALELNNPTGDAKYSYVVKTSYFPEYYFEGNTGSDRQVALMAIVDRAFISLLVPSTKDAIAKSNIVIRSLLSISEKDYLAEFNSNYWSIVGAMGSFLFSMTFVSHVSFMVQHLVEEKENRIKEGLQIMGSSSFAVVNGIVLITFGFLISTLYSNSRYASIATCVVIVAAGVAAYVVCGSSLEKSSLKYLFTALIAPFGSIAEMILIIERDAKSDGINFSTIMTTYPSQNVSFILLLVCQFANCIVNMALAWYLDAILPSQFGTPRPWYFLFTSSYWAKEITLNNSSLFNSVPQYPNNIIVQPESQDQKVALQIRNLSKTYKLPNGIAVNAIENISFNVMEGQVLAFLGRNGCGKSTTIGILTGLFPATAGDAYFLRDGQCFALSEHLSAIRESLGVCPQHDWLWNSLTVRQTLEVYAGLKKIKPSDIPGAVEQAILSGDLVKKADALAGTLSGGQRRKLSLSIAFMGDSKFVFLDEMSAGVDPLSRRAMWKIVSENRAGRTIIMTTHFMDEAEILGDNVVILSTGKVCGVGSPLYLKEKVGKGFDIAIVQSPDARNDIKESASWWLQILRKHSPQVALLECHENEAVFQVPNSDKKHLSLLFKEIEKHRSQLGIKSYGFSGTSFHDVFHAITTETERREVEKSNSRVVSMDGNINDYPHIEPKVNFVSHVAAIFWKRAILTIGDVKGTLTPLILVLIMVILFPTLGKGINFKCPEPTATPIPTSKGEIKYFDARKLGNGTFSDKLFPVAPKTALFDTTWAKSNQTIGLDDRNALASFVLSKKDQFVAAINVETVNQPWSNYELIFDGNRPISVYEGVHLAHTALLNQALKTTGRSIDASFQILPRPSYSSAIFEQSNTLAYLMTGLMIVMALAIPLSSSMPLAKERLTGTRQQQLFSGISLVTYYVAHFIWDTLVVMLYSLLLSISLCVSEFWKVDFVLTFATLTICGLSIVVLGYSVSRLTKTTSGTVIVTAGFLIVSGLFLITFADVGKKTYLDKKNSLVLVSPLETVINMFMIGSNFVELQCKLIDGKPLTSNYGMEPYLKPLMYQLVQIIALWIILAIVEKICSNPISFARGGKNQSNPSSMAMEDTDVVNERTRILQEVKTGQVTDKISIQALSKSYGKLNAVSNVSFGMKANECYGLLGVNGAGKTTTLRIASGQERSTSGTCIVDGKDVMKDAKGVQQSIGVCTQFDTLFDGLTVRQHLAFYCRLKGLGPESKRMELVDWLIERLDLTAHAQKKSVQLSGGNKRKLSFAIAMIGNPPVMIFDEPSTGMDPVSKLFLWNILKDLRKHHTIVLTTHAMEEVAAVCNRIGILVGGKLVAVGTQQHLKSKFGKTLEIQVIASSEKAQLSFTDKLRQRFNQLVVLEQVQSAVRYQLPTDPNLNGGYTLADLFDIFEDFKHQYSIQYEIAQTSLEQVFIRFAEQGNMLYAIHHSCLEYYFSWVFIVVALAGPFWITLAFLLKVLIFENTSISILIIWAAVNGIVLITFGFLISTLYSNSRYASIATCVVIVAAGVAAYVVCGSSLEKSSLKYLFTALIAPFGSIAEMILIIERDAKSDGINFSTIMTTYPSQNVSFILLLVCQFANCIVNMALAWYLDAILPSQFGTPRPWYFLFTSSYWAKEITLNNSSLFNSVPQYPNNIIVQPESRDQKVALQIRNLSKTYKLPNGIAVNAIENISFNVMEGQVLAFLGRNGCGKSTTIGILTGLFPATAGDAYFLRDGQCFALSEHLSAIRESLGVCPQHDWLWNSLTVRQTLEVYAGLKKIKPSDIPGAVEQAILSGDLVKKADALAGTLSGGQRRKLSLSIAFMGDSKFVFLDEMSAGVDPLSRRAMWKIVSENRAGRTIIMTTHFMDEAEILGDNVVILSTGKVCGVGSPLYLKEKVGKGFDIAIVQTPDARNDIKESASWWLQILRKHSPQVALLECHENEAVFQVPNSDKKHLSLLFKEIEKHRSQLGIKSYGFSGTSFHDVFHAITTETERREVEKSDSRVVSMDGNINDYPHIEPKVNFVSHVAAIFWKRAILTIGDVKGTLTPLILVLIMVILFPTLGKGINFKCPEPTATPIPTSKGEIKYFDARKLGNGTFSDKLFPVAPKTALFDTTWAKSNQTIGLDDRNALASFVLSKKDQFVAAINVETVNQPWSNYELIFDGNRPISVYEGVHLAHTALLNQALKTTGRSIDASFQILPRPSYSSAIFEQSNTLAYLMTGLMIVMALAIPLSSSMPLAKERLTGTRQQQLFSGISLVTYYVAHFIWDTLVVIVYSLLLSISLCVSEFWKVDFVLTFATLTICGLSIVVLGYSVSRLTKTTSGTVIVTAGFLISVSFFVISSADVGNTGYLDKKNVFVLLSPLLTYINMFMIGSNFLQIQCRLIDGKPLTSNYGMEPYLKPLMYQLVQIIALWIILAIVEKICSNPISFARGGKNQSNPSSMAMEDTDVVNERTRILQEVKTGQVTDKISIQALSKSYGKLNAVSNVSFGMKANECYGLLGVNGAGKTTTLRIASGQERSTSGTCIVDGKDVMKDAKGVQQSIGVCTQFDTLFDGLTVRQHLAFYCRLKGLGPESKRMELVDWLIERLDLTAHAQKKSVQLSGGNKRKLSFAIAMIGNPPVMIFDEPSTGMDPVSKLFLWNILKDLRKHHTIVLTTHAMEEVAAVCNRIGILVGGKLVAVGTQQHLKSKFGKTLEIQVIASSEKAQLSFTDKLRQRFNQLVVLEQVQSAVRYQLPTDPNLNGGYTLADLFDIFEDFKHQYSIQYEIAQTSLEQVFIRFAEQGNMDSEV
ncbi:hypothetical protein HDV02_003053 [Globomyces sp. JEL0801]|nr:hypothetical protein HDV02_003053 [Globomyces sp. JEL0801]